ncbi:MAG: sigma-54 dependent transcriptional regulator [Bacteroidia bacterium]|jgi:transcriptional regulator with PAS, ATPase and Fis domain|nr:sigma-54 dependent transcriptional regulator [Bacteroidia bacterium]
MTTLEIKQRFGIIGSSPLLDRAIDIATQVAPTDLSVLIVGESGTGKESFPKIIHQLSSRKHGQYIAVNCGAIPEGTIDSELFGHEKGSFTGATEARKGYFEVADGGTIFLDEVAEMPLATQARLLRVLESGEFIRVGSSKVQKTNVRVVAATNVNMMEAIGRNKFREDLYYRLSTVPISLPALRERRGDIHLLFRKFASDFATKYRMPVIKLMPDAEQALSSYYWHGNIRQLKNVTEQLSIIEKNREIDVETLKKYLPDYKTSSSSLPVLSRPEAGDPAERDFLYSMIQQLSKELNELKAITAQLIQGGRISSDLIAQTPGVQKYVAELPAPAHTAAALNDNPVVIQHASNWTPANEDILLHEDVTEDSLSLQDKEIELIRRALEKHRGKRKSAARELGISERTLYRKINEYDIKG